MFKPIVRLDVTSLIAPNRSMFSSLFLAEVSGIPHNLIMRKWRNMLTRLGISPELYICYRRDTWNRHQPYFQLPDIVLFAACCKGIDPIHILQVMIAYCVAEDSQVANVTVSIQYLETLLSNTLDKLVYIDTGEVPRSEVRYPLGETLRNTTRYSRWGDAFNMSVHLNGNYRMCLDIPPLLASVNMDHTKFKTLVNNVETYSLPKAVIMLYWTQLMTFNPANIHAPLWPFNITYAFNHLLDQDIYDVANWAHNAFEYNGMYMHSYENLQT
jgi:hypothetical protein